MIHSRWLGCLLEIRRPILGSQGGRRRWVCPLRRDRGRATARALSLAFAMARRPGLRGAASLPARHVRRPLACRCPPLWVCPFLSASLRRPGSASPFLTALFQQPALADPPPSAFFGHPLSAGLFRPTPFRRPLSAPHSVCSFPPPRFRRPASAGPRPCARRRLCIAPLSAPTADLLHRPLGCRECRPGPLQPRHSLPRPVVQSRLPWRWRAVIR